MFLYLIIRIHGSLWTENCTWWNNFEKNMDDIFKRYKNIFIPPGVGIYFIEEGLKKENYHAYHKWLLYQIGHWRNTHSRGDHYTLDYTTIAKEGCFLYKMLETVGVSFDPTKHASAFKTRQDRNIDKRIDEINNTNETNATSDRPVATRKWKKAKRVSED